MVWGTLTFSPRCTATSSPVLLEEGTPLSAGERAELIPEEKPVAGAVTHLPYHVSKP